MKTIKTQEQFIKAIGECVTLGDSWDLMKRVQQRLLKRYVRNLSHVKPWNCLTMRDLCFLQAAESELERREFIKAQKAQTV